MSKPVVFAVAAHPDDIEIMMAGTLLQLRAAGYEIHVMNLSSGHCASITESKEAISARRLGEARDSATLLQATLHNPITDDLEILYSMDQLRRLAAVMREVEPTLVLTHSPQDYMEDHMNACRLTVTAAFGRGMPNFSTSPQRRAVSTDLTLYHALPYGLCDALRRRIMPGQYVDISDVLSVKREALACHRSQKEWLDKSQGIDSYLHAMEEMSREVGSWSKKFEYAEGWRRHSHLGFCSEEADPLSEALGEKTFVCPVYEAALKQGRTPVFE